MTNNAKPLILMQKTEAPLISRRSLIKTGAIFSSFFILPAAVVRPAYAARRDRNTQNRDIAFYNLHTGEKFKGEYLSGGSYNQDALSEINHIMRDFRSEEVADMDRELINLLTDLRSNLDADNKPIQIVCAYRSPETNAEMRSRSKGVAQHSYHVQAKAIDIRMEGYSSSQIRDAALAMGRGGVGFYRKSKFVHVDTGPVRRWG